MRPPMSPRGLLRGPIGVSLVGSTPLVRLTWLLTVLLAKLGGAASFTWNKRSTTRRTKRLPALVWNCSRRKGHN